jgi:hypothetical protein
MSRTIHGKSTKALKHLRKKPAALAVYWCYVARMNNEGVAWPGARGLAHDTEWNKSTCLEARQLLVSLCALEPMPDYIRPEWRKLAEGEQRKRKGLDRSEYFRPTGYIMVGEQKLMLLYNGGDEANDIDEKAPDVRRGSTSTPQDNSGNGHLPGSTELDSPPNLDSSQSEGNSTLIAPDGAAGASSSPFKVVEPGQPEFNKARVFDCVAFAAFGIKDMRDLRAVEAEGKKRKNPAGARIGMISDWLKKFYMLHTKPEAEKVEAERAIAEKVAAFYKAWKSRRQYSIPHDASKFADEWIAWTHETLPAPKMDGTPEGLKTGKLLPGANLKRGE